MFSLTPEITYQVPKANIDNTKLAEEALVITQPVTRAPLASTSGNSGSRSNHKAQLHDDHPDEISDDSNENVFESVASKTNKEARRELERINRRRAELKAQLAVPRPQPKRNKHKFGRSPIPVSP